MARLAPAITAFLPRLEFGVIGVGVAIGIGIEPFAILSIPIPIPTPTQMKLQLANLFLICSIQSTSAS